MSQSAETSQDELLELIKMEPGEAFREYPEELRKIRRQTESEPVKRLIDYVFEKYDINDQEAEQ